MKYRLLAAWVWFLVAAKFALVALALVAVVASFAFAEDVGFFKPIPVVDREKAATATIPAMAPAQAREADGVYLSREEAADLFGRVAQMGTLQQKVDAQATEIAALRQIIELKDQIAALQEQKYQKQAELTEIAEKKAAMYKDQLDGVKKSADGKVRSARAMGFAGAGAAIGSMAPPFGPLIGAAIGGVLGYFLPVEGP